MTNRERLAALPAVEYAAELKALFASPLAQYVNFALYFDGGSENIADFLVTIGEADVMPSELEILQAFAPQGLPTPEEREKYICTHAKHLPILGEKMIFDEPHFILADAQDAVSVPVSRCLNVRMAI